MVVGSLNVDLVVRVPAIPAPGETVVGSDFARAPGGKGANAAAAAARLGAATWIVGAVGDDDFGEMTRADLAAYGVALDCLGTGTQPTGVALITVDANGENAIAVASGANAELSAAEVTKALGTIEMDNAIVLANLEISDDAVRAAAAGASQRGWSFVLNPAPARPLPADVVAHCAVLTPNEHELDALGGSAEALLDAGAGAVVVTRGAAGADLHRAGQTVHHQDAFPTQVVDTTGAGDTFSATLAWALAAGRSLEDAVRLAAAAGALACRSVGARACLPTADEVVATAQS